MTHIQTTTRATLKAAARAIRFSPRAQAAAKAVATKRQADPASLVRAATQAARTRRANAQAA